MKSSLLPQLTSTNAPETLSDIRAELKRRRVFSFDVLHTGLFPAVGKGTSTEATSGYRSIWLRDNAHIAYAHFAAGRTEAAVKTALALADFLLTQRQRIVDIIEDRADPAIPMNRPHIRFDGETGRECDEKWPHAQNDALGYFLFLYCTLSAHGVLNPQRDHLELLAGLVRYLNAIEYWCDEDSGHWEEQLKIAASSIGTVNAGLRAYLSLLGKGAPNDSVSAGHEVATHMLARGTAVLNDILPFETIQADPKKHRMYDAALVFLIDPLDIVDTETADNIVSNVEQHLMGEYGIARYPEDSYWGPNYRQIPPEKRTIDLSEDIIQRDAFSMKGKEAQWTLFDPIIAIYYGRRFAETGEAHFYEQQLKYLNRALSQLIVHPDAPDRWILPEAFFFENGNWVPNDHAPLQWAHANLMRAVYSLKDDHS